MIITLEDLNNEMDIASSIGGGFVASTLEIK